MKKRNAGFTLVELIVVIAILGILAGIAIPVYSNYVRRANQAADEQLIAAVNTAAAAAVLEAENTDMAKLTGALQTNAAKEVPGISVWYRASGDGVSEAFSKYFKGNESLALKWYEGLNFVNGVFVGATEGNLVRTMTYELNGKEYTFNYSQDQLKSYSNSNLAGLGIENTLDLMDTLVSGVGADHTVAASLTSDQQFKDYLESVGLDPEIDSQVAQGLAMYASDRLSNVDSAALVEALRGKSFDDGLRAMYQVVSGGAAPGFSDKAVSAAMMYALSAGFANTEAGAGYKDALQAGNVHDLASLTSYMAPLYSDANFISYLESDAALTDASGLVGALSLVSGNDAAMIDYLKENGGEFWSLDMADMLSSLLGTDGT